MSNAISRRTFVNGAVAVTGAAALTPLLSACGDSSQGKGGASSVKGLAGVLPTYQAVNSVKPDIPSVKGAAGSFTDPGFLSYPATQTRTVTGKPGKGGSYTAVTPLWAAIPAAGNSYQQAMNEALGATITIKPANGVTYNTVVPTMTAAKKLPDWIQLPTWWNATFNVGELVGKQIADLTPYLSGDKIKQYPNLAAQPTLAWQVGAWEDKLYGIPSFSSGLPLAGCVFYRRDILEAKGITADQVKSADDFWNLGKELTNAKAGVWAFGDVWTYLFPAWDLPAGFAVQDGKLVSGWDLPQMLEALNWHYKLAKSGYMHPDTLAGNNNSSGTRFYAGQELIQGGGTSGFSLSDYQSGTAADKNYRRGAFNVISADGKSTPKIFMGASTSIMSYLNAKLKPAQIEECLSIANYLAAPFGSVEYTLVTYGVEGVHYNMVNGVPTYTSEGQKLVQAQTYPFLSAAPQVISNPGADIVTRDYTEWTAKTAPLAYKSVFYGMNITVPQRFATVAAGQAVNDTITDVVHGIKKVSDFQAALATWKSSGGDRLTAWYETNVLAKYGTGQ